MPKLITASCFLLFWVFCEISGGGDFTPRERTIISQAPFAHNTSRNLIYQRPNTTATNAAYVPVTTEPLRVIQVQPAVQKVSTPQQATSLVRVAVFATEPVPEPAVAGPSIDLRIVAGTRINLRRGPGTNHDVLNTLPLGTAAEVLATNENGWAQIRLQANGQIGWMAERLLSES